MAVTRIHRLILSVVLIFSSTISFVVSFSPVNPQSKQRHPNSDIVLLQGVVASYPTYTTSKEKRTLYDILGASPDATRAVLKQKYLNLARMTHPDANPTVYNSDKFTEVAYAWEVLSDQKSRLKYDRSLMAEEIVGNFDEVTDEISKVSAPFFQHAVKVAGEMTKDIPGEISKASAPIFEHAIKITEEVTKDIREAAVPFLENAFENAFKTTIRFGRMAYVAGQKAGAAMR